MPKDIITEVYDVPVSLGVADELIEGVRGRLAGLKADTPTGYEAVRVGIAEVRTIRTDVERSRKELKASALDWGRKVDSEARRVTDLLLQIEEPLKLEKKTIDDEKRRKREQKLEAQRLAEEAKDRAEREERERAEAEQREKIRKEQYAEDQRLVAERKTIEAERAEAERKNREEEEKLAEARRELAKQQAEIDKANSERQETERRNREAEALKERQEQEATAKIEREAEVARIREQRKPDVEKLFELGIALTEHKLPSVFSEWAKTILVWVAEDLITVRHDIEEAIERMEAK